MACGTAKALMAQRNSDNSIRIYIAQTVPETWTEDSGIDWSDAKAAKAEVLERGFSDWSDAVKDLVRKSNEEEIRFWPLYGMPKPSESGRWNHKAGMTLIGDAAHVMPPWTGKGVNMAMLDGVELGRGLASALTLRVSGEEVKREEVLKGCDEAIRGYEEGMWDRMEEEIEACRMNQGFLFHADGPQALVRLAKNAGEAKVSSTGEQVKD
jgi:2-polyprenyl-6-methoxyphenol hydroxylase-like FAD-dependent oxidoreductase